MFTSILYEKDCYPEYANENISQLVVTWMGQRCPSPSIMYPTVVIYSLILFLGLVGNVCTCIVIFANKNMHNPTNYYLISLALSDLLILILGLPMELYMITDFNYPYRFPEIVCKSRAFLVEFTSYASILIICLFSVERWIAICFPLKSQLFSGNSRSMILISICWFLSFLFSLPVAFVVRINKVPLPDFAQNKPWTHLVSSDSETIDRTEFCAMDINDLKNQKKIIYFAFFTFFLIPAIIITVMYGHIAVRMHKSETLLGAEKSGPSNKRSVLKVLVSVVITFFLFWLPFHMQRLLSIFLNENQAQASTTIQSIFTLVFYISGYCYYSNSACNPILYNIFSTKYRLAFCRTILGERLTKKFCPSFKSERSFLTQSYRANAMSRFSSLHRTSSRFSEAAHLRRSRREKGEMGGSSTPIPALRRISSDPQFSLKVPESSEEMRPVSSSQAFL
ncbi:unnamed protein product, partial [Mesorhabditis belari]|uniref:G-protein coupled receptors family 1 profile domain-containing protein n=1 Tax=Mesorhabditis belari TaxID=2138241 RepID=A0AAF3F1Q8_9BILA